MRAPQYSRNSKRVPKYIFRSKYSCPHRPHKSHLLGWRLILEEYGPERIYIQGTKNTAIDGLSRLELVNEEEEIQHTMTSLAEHFALTKKDLTKEAYQTNFTTIMSYQQKNKNLIKIVKTNTKDYSIIFFTGQIRSILLFVLRIIL